MLDSVQLAAIMQEARACFLYEDAPDYLSILEKGINQLISDDTAINPQTEYPQLMRATHSLKGGAGLAELPSLSKLAHTLEDLLQALYQGRLSDPQPAYNLLLLGIEQVRALVAAASIDNQSETSEHISVINDIEILLQQLPKTTESGDDFHDNKINPAILKSILEVDLEDCLLRVEKLLPASGNQQPLSSQQIKFLRQELYILAEECLLLGQTLSLKWLINFAEQVNQALNHPNIPLVQMTIKAIAYVRQRRLQTLNPNIQEKKPKKIPDNNQHNQNIEEKKPETIPNKQPTTPKEISINPETNPVNLNLRIPVSRLDRMSNAVGEILINHEKLSLYQMQLYQVNSILKKQTLMMNPIRQQVQDFYNRMATPVTNVQISNFNQILPDSEQEFDPLELDQYTEIHSTLQDFQELMVRVEESRSDMEVIAHELQAGLEQLRQQVDGLREDLTDSRLVPFSFLTDRFITLLENMSHKYKKSVGLEIIGENTLIDQVILEQLQTPLTHLINNALAHGIESPEDREFFNKPTKGKIILSAEVIGNQIKISVKDDGLGIDTEQVYKKAVKMGLCSNTVKLTQEEIIELLFTNGFSTASQITDISGRGVGLDVVKLQVKRLQGKISVNTEVSKGTTFTITLPLTLSILPVLLCNCDQQIIAIPSLNIIEIISLDEFEIKPTVISANSETKESHLITWRDRTISIYNLIKLLPYTRSEISESATILTPSIGIVLDIEGKLIVVTVDSLVGEKELVFKPFDSTIPVPDYVAGCTVLGTGQVVPILAPTHFHQLIEKTALFKPSKKLEVQSNPSATILIVDDSIAVCRLLNQVLTSSGYQVVQCRDGKEALEELNQSRHNFNLVISDIEMPRMDGFTLLKQVRSHPRWHSLNMIMLTSRENAHHRQKAMSLGATSYFTKPFHPVDLLKAIPAFL